jgi:sigma-B regulation protein RsbU (phosphoserine phosphatase)
MLNAEAAAKLGRELELAAKVQRSMLPGAVPEVPEYSFWVSWEPAWPVGGDLYYFSTFPTGEILVLAADVAGKGVGAAMGMAALAGAVPVLLDETGTNLTRLVSRLNKSVFRWASQVDRFVTLIAVVLDPVAHRLRIVDAAFGGLIRRHDGTLDSLGGLDNAAGALGVVNEFTYRVAESHLGAGDAVVLASDGIINATNANGEVYGPSRLHQVLARTQPDATRLGEVVRASVKDFTGGLRSADDTTIVCFARDD